MFQERKDFRFWSPRPEVVDRGRPHEAPKMRHESHPEQASCGPCRYVCPSVGVVVLVALVFISSHVYAGSKPVIPDVRPNVTMKMMVIEPDSPAMAVVVLYAGGKGTIESSSFF